MQGRKGGGAVGLERHVDHYLSTLVTKISGNHLAAELEPSIFRYSKLLLAGLSEQVYKFTVHSQ